MNKTSIHPFSTILHLPFPRKLNISKEKKTFIYIYIWRNKIFYCTVKIQCQIKEFLRQVWEEKRGKINMKKIKFPNQERPEKMLKILYPAFAITVNSLYIIPYYPGPMIFLALKWLSEFFFHAGYCPFLRNWWYHTFFTAFFISKFLNVQIRGLNMGAVMV